MLLFLFMGIRFLLVLFISEMPSLHKSPWCKIANDSQTRIERFVKQLATESHDMICLYHLLKVTSRYFRHCTENVVYELSLLIVHILKRYCRVLTSFAVQLDFLSDDWSVSFTFAFISSNVFSPLVGILSEAIVVTISVMSSILSMSGNALMLQIDNLSAYDQNFISFKVKKALRIAKKEKPRSLQFRLIYDSPIHTRGLITMVHCYGSLPLTSLSELVWHTKHE